MTTILGSKLKQLREENGYSLEQIAEKANITPAQLELIEAHATTPSLAISIRLSRALNVRLGTIMDGCEAQMVSVTRADEKPDRGVSFSNGTLTNPSNLNFFPLAQNKYDRSMEPFFIDVDPLTSAEAALSSHEGEEFVYVISGEVGIVLGDKNFILGVGDTIYYDSLVPHKIYATCETARVLAVIYSPW